VRVAAVGHSFEFRRTGYHIVVLGNETRFHRNVTTAERAASVTLFHLVPDMTYRVKVAAYTGAGVGQFHDRDRISMSEQRP